MHRKGRSQTQPFNFNQAVCDKLAIACGSKQDAILQ